MFPETGLYDAYGQPVRIAIADFVKDVVADFRSFPHPGKMVEEWTRKLAPFWNAASEMYRNRDFWGTEIFSQREIGEPWAQHAMENVKEGAQYLAGTGQPFSIRAGQRFGESGGGALGYMAPWFGFVPAPRYATQTPAQTRAAEIMGQNMPKRAMTKEQSARAQAEGQIIRDLRTGKINSAGQLEERARAGKIDVRDSRTMTQLRERVLWTPMQYQVNKMDVKQAMDIFDLGNPAERLELAPVLMLKIQRAFEGGRLDMEKTGKYVRLVIPYLRQAAAQQVPASKR